MTIIKEFVTYKAVATDEEKRDIVTGNNAAVTMAKFVERYNEAKKHFEDRGFVLTERVDGEFSFEGVKTYS